MKKNLVALLIAILFYQPSNAQKEFTVGYIINNTGDTIRGEIDNVRWVKNPNSILFKINNQTAKNYSVSDIQGFGMEHISFVRKKVSLDITPHLSNKLLESENRIVVEDTVLFLKQLVKGRISLYYSRDSNTKPHFFTEKLGEHIVELIDHKFLKYVRSDLYEVHLDSYNKQLNDLCQDCSYYAGKKFKYSYDEGTLVQAIIKYNAFFGDSKPILASKKEAFKSMFFLNAAAGIYQYETRSAIENFSKSGLTTFALGGGLLLELPSLRRRIGVKFNVLCTLYQEDAQVMYHTYIPPKNSSYLGFYITPQYAIFKDIAKRKEVYLSAGLSLESRLSEKSSNDLYKGMSSMLGYKVGVGTRYKKLDFELSYNTNDLGLRPFLYVSGNIQRIALTFGYALGKR